MCGKTLKYLGLLKVFASLAHDVLYSTILQVYWFHLSLQEASRLSSLKPALDQKSIPLIGVVHETIGVEEFKEFFKGDIYLDSEVGF